MKANNAIRKCVETAIRTENDVGQFYDRMAMHYRADEELKNLFQTLSEDESEHQKQFRDLLRAVESIDTEVTPVQLEYLTSMVLPHRLSSSLISRFARNNPKNRDDLIVEVYRFEKEALAFYEVIMETIGNNPILQEIIDSEKKHVQAAMKILITGTEYTSLEDVWPEDHLSLQ